MAESEDRLAHALDWCRQTALARDGHQPPFPSKSLWDRFKVRPKRRLTTRHAISPKVRFNILQRDGFRCVYCGRTPEQGSILQIDHVLPVCQGGKDIPSNLVTACELCNNGKGKR